MLVQMPIPIVYRDDRLPKDRLIQTSNTNTDATKQPLHNMVPWFTLMRFSFPSIRLHGFMRASLSKQPFHNVGNEEASMVPCPESTGNLAWCDMRDCL